MLLISHRLHELYGAASRATVLRDGGVVADVPLPATPEQRAGASDGRARDRRPLRKREIEPGETALEIEGLGSRDGQLRPTTLSVRRGEIVGVAGLVGSGKAELGLALGGGDPSVGSVRVLGTTRRRLAAALRAREWNRLRPRRPQEDRAAADAQRGREPLGRLDEPAHARRRDQHALGARARSRRDRALQRRDRLAKSLITTLSGGNQQKVVLGRFFARGLDVLVLSEPTRGIDVGARSEIYRLMQEHAARAPQSS